MNPIDPTSVTPGASAAASGSGTSSLSDPNTFLQLLVSELKNQNPLDPTDPSQYLTETAQFAMVQQINNMASQTSSALAASLLGRQVTGTTASGEPVTGVVSGISIGSGGSILDVGSSAVPLADVTSVMAPTASSSTGSSSTGSATSAPSSDTPSNTSPSTTGTTTPTSSGTTTPPTDQTGPSTNQTSTQTTTPPTTPTTTTPTSTTSGSTDPTTSAALASQTTTPA